MKNRSIYILLLLFTGCFSLSAQVRLKSDLIFSNPNDSLRNIKNLSFPTDSLNAAPAYAVQQNNLNFGQVFYTSDSLSITMQPAIGNYADGLMVSFISAITNTGAVHVQLQNLPFVQVLKPDGLPLDSAEIIPGLPLTMVYSDSAFRIISSVNSYCPANTYAINENTCIETEERAPSTFWLAVKTCGDEGGHLCNWNEWYVACFENPGLILNTTNNWEWIDDAANNQNEAKLVGNGGCEAGTHVVTTSSFSFRCCYSK